MHKVKLIRKMKCYASITTGGSQSLIRWKPCDAKKVAEASISFHSHEHLPIWMNLSDIAEARPLSSNNLYHG